MNDYGHGNEINPQRTLTDAEVAQMTQLERDELMANCDWEPADPGVCDACAAFLFTPPTEPRVEVTDVVMVRLKNVEPKILRDFTRWTADSGVLPYLGTSSSGMGRYQACHRTEDLQRIRRWFEGRGIQVSS